MCEQLYQIHVLVSYLEGKYSAFPLLSCLSKRLRFCRNRHLMHMQRRVWSNSYLKWKYKLQTECYKMNTS